jgi:hypothetical protein
MACSGTSPKFGHNLPSTVKSIANQMKYFSFPVGYPPPLVAICTWS